jgi:CheY-like chemotaxis protein
MKANDQVGLQILLIEDDPAQAYLVDKALQRWKTPYKLHVCSTAEDAMDFVGRRKDYTAAVRPHLVLLDLNLPKEPGFSVLKAIKGNPGLRNIAVLVLTSSSAESDQKAAFDLHANAYFQKPMSYDIVEQMFEAIEKFWRLDVRHRLPNGPSVQ